MKGDRKCVKCGRWAFDMSPERDTKGKEFVCSKCDEVKPHYAYVPKGGSNKTN